MRIKRMWALFVARNYEFIRDKAGFGWNILFPFLIVAGFGLMFNSNSRTEFKAGVFPVQNQEAILASRAIPERFKAHKFLKLVPFENRDQAMDRLIHHKIDILLNAADAQYWISDSSPKGALMEIILREALVPGDLVDKQIEKQVIQGEQIRYIDWLFPGILGMNIMFSALFGVGYVIVRYRRIGVLKRLKATPVTAFEFLSAQLASRVVVLMFSSLLVWIGCDLLFSFQMRGTYLDALVVFLVGTICLSSLGLVLACRGTNEELTNGIINFICWPMMFLSEVWFSIEGAASWVRQAAQFLPLTHFLTAARRVINDGAALSQVSHELTLMVISSIAFLIIGSLFFSWTK